MRQLVRIIDQGLAALLITAMAAILITVSWQIVSRYLMSDPASFTEELARFLLIWIGILGAAYAYRKGAHLGFNMILERQSQRTRQWLSTFIQVVVIWFAVVVMLYGGAEIMVMAFQLNQISAALSIQIGLVYFVLPLSGALFILYSLVNIYNIWLPEHKEPV